MQNDSLKLKNNFEFYIVILHFEICILHFGK